jgi:hypothetical protein
MQQDDRDLTGYSRPDLIRYVLRNCVRIPEEKMQVLGEMKAWCMQHVGDERPGSILMEAMEGWLDYFDGEWCDLADEFSAGDYLFWFEKTKDRVLFTLTWL